MWDNNESYGTSKRSKVKINHLLVTTSDHIITFLAALKKFDEYLTENNIEKHVVFLSDGQGS